jgi:curved DNA-binding protein CbpA
MNPFTALGLPARADLDDEQVRHAWRTIAAATHPDRPDGGDPAAYTAASAAYARLRTAWSRSETLADLAAQTPPAPPGLVPAPDTGTVRGAVALLPGQIRRGRLARMAVRSLAAAAAGLLAVTVIPGTPSEPAVVTGAVLWWALTIRSDLAPPPGR